MIQVYYLLTCLVINYANANVLAKDYCPDKIALLSQRHTLPHVFEHIPDAEEEHGWAKHEQYHLLKKLKELPWIRYGIVPKRALLAHADMVMKFKRLSSKQGLPVVLHIASHFEKLKLGDELDSKQSSSTLI